MIITKTPMRTSFCGGGSDLPEFYKHEQGAIIGTSINQYVYILIHKYFTDEILLKYKESELVQSVEDIKFIPIKEALKLFNINKKIDITVVADLPKEGGSGLGGSTAFSVGLFNALCLFKKIKNSNKINLAKAVTNFEINILKNPIGLQDQYLSAIGGINYIQFNPDNTIDIENIKINENTKRILQDRLIFFYTGKTRDANKLLKNQQDLIKGKFNLYKEIVSYAKLLKEDLKRNYIEDFGRIIHENWLVKKKLSNNISNNGIDSIYNTALKNGAEGGKLCGAGNGGFLLFYCKKEYQDKLKQSINLRSFNFKFEENGTHEIYNDER